MKFWRQFVVLSFMVVLLSLGTINNTLFSKVTPGQTTEPFRDVKFFRVYFDEIDTAHNIVITMNALESKYEKGYVIVEVTTDEEYVRLLSTGLRLEEIPDPQADKVAAMKEAALVQSTGIPGYPCYRTVEETFTTAAAIAANFPGLATWTDEGDSWEKTNGTGGYDLYVLKLTNSAVTEPKPKFFLTGAIHAREYTTAELLTRFAEYLVDNYDIDPDVTWLLDHHEIHMMLHTNPDGRKQAETGLSWRKNTNQNYCSPTSTYRGADLNRNFQFKWNSLGGSSGDPCNLTYRGPYAASEPETQAIQNYIFSQFPDQRGPNDTDPAPLNAMGIYLDIHSHGQEILYQPSWASDLVQPVPNVTELITLARKIGYYNDYWVYGSTPDGTSKLFGYGEMGIPSFTVELGTTFFEDCTYFENILVPNNIPALLHAFKVVRTPFMTSAGPDTVNPALNAGSTPPGVPAGTYITLTATLDDTRYNNNTGSEPWQNIADAQYYIDKPPWASGPEPFAYDMSPVDGYFNSPLEDAEATINTTGLSEGRHIIFVRGQDSAGNWGAFSGVFLYINNSGGAPPTAPANLTASAVSCNQIDLAWTDNSDNETSFKIERSTDGAIFSEIDLVGADVTSYSDTTVAEDTTYWYRVRAANSYGDSGYSNIDSTATPLCPSNPPAAPDNLEARAHKYTMELTWSDNSDNEEGFRIYRGNSPLTLVLIDTVGADTTYYEDSGLTRKTFYYYKVCAYNTDGEGCSATLQTKTK